MSFERTNETNFSNSLILDKNKNNIIKTTHREQIIKKNKIINIRIYQNYSNNKNSNTFYNQCTNKFINNDSFPLKITNDMGIKTMKEKEKSKIIKNKISEKSVNKKLQDCSLKKKNNKNSQTYRINYNFNKTLSPNLKKKETKNNNRTITANRKYKKNIIQNHSYNRNKAKTLIIDLKNSIKNQKRKNKYNKKICYSNKYLINKTNIIEKNNSKNEQNNNSDEKNKVAKKYSLFNLKNDNKYLIINDGHYDSHYHENSKLSINNIYDIKREKKIDFEDNKSSFLPSEHKLIYYIKSENNFDKFPSKNIYYKISNINSLFKSENSKNNVNENMDNNYIKRKNNFEKLLIEKCNNITINEEKKKNRYINYEENKKKMNDEIKQDKDFCYNVNKFLSEYNKNKIDERENNIKDIINMKDVTKKNIINEITKDSFQIISKKNLELIIQKYKRTKIPYREESKINNETDEIKEKKEKKVIKNFIKVQKEKKIEKLKKKEVNPKIIEDNKLNKKYESFLHNEIIQEDENTIKIEDLLKTCTDESIKGNQYIDEVNNRIIGDEKTFFNNSKIPQVQECNYIQKENFMNINNKINKQNLRNNNRNKQEKINIKNYYNRLKKSETESKQEKKFISLLNDNNNIKTDFKQIDIIKSNTCTNRHRQYLFNIDKVHQKSLNKEKIYNYLFNEKENQVKYNNKKLLIKDNNDINILDTLIKKINSDNKSCTSNLFYRKNNTSRIDFLKYNRRNKSFKDSYSKYYLNKLEMENKFLIPQLSKKSETFFNIKFFNRNQFN